MKTEIFLSFMLLAVCAIAAPNSKVLSAKFVQTLNAKPQRYFDLRDDLLKQEGILGFAKAKYKQGKKTEEQLLAAILIERIEKADKVQKLLAFDIRKVKSERPLTYRGLLAKAGAEALAKHYRTFACPFLLIETFWRGPLYHQDLRKQSWGSIDRIPFYAQGYAVYLTDLSHDFKDNAKRHLITAWRRRLPLCATLEDAAICMEELAALGDNDSLKNMLDWLIVHTPKTGRIRGEYVKTGMSILPLLATKKDAALLRKFKANVRPKWGKIMYWENDFVALVTALEKGEEVDMKDWQQTWGDHAIRLDR